MRYEEICLIMETPILARLYRRFGLDILEENGIRITGLDCSPILAPVAYEKTKLAFSKDEISYYFNHMPKSTLILNVVNYRPESRFIYKAITKNHLAFFYMMINVDAKRSFADRGKAYLHDLSLKRILYSLNLRIPKGIFRYRSAEFVMGGGFDEAYKKLFWKTQMCNRNTKLMYAHTNDYDECIRIQNEPRLIAEDYCVFIDECFPFHPDLLGNGIELNPQLYYTDMERFFRFIENEFNLQVIIAAHPRSTYIEKKEYFQGFRIIKGKTCLLIRDAKFVIYHKSNSISSIVAFRKPIIFSTNNEIEMKFIEGALTIRRMAKTLGKPVLNVSNLYNKKMIEVFLSIDNDKYTDFMTQYICKDYNGKVEGKLIGNILLDYLKD